ncbi:hypothetical protein GCM10007908_31860 [Rhizobium albus]|nr:hypothetical protein GCM10007908_31860 [Rhizobium albus]
MNEAGHEDRASVGADAGAEDCGTLAMDDDNPLQSIVTCVRAAGDGDVVSIADIVTALGRASFAPLLLVPGLIIISPLSGIPGLSSIGGFIIALISVQMALQRSHVWLPRWILKREVGRDRLNRALDFMERPVRFADRITRPRLELLVQPPLALIPQFLCVACGAAMPFFELVPFSSSLLATAVTLFATALVTRDGLLALFGYIVLGGGGSALFLFVGNAVEAM